MAPRYICTPEPLAPSRAEDSIREGSGSHPQREATQLARTLALQTGKTISEIVLHSLRQYRLSRGGKAPPKEVEAWRRLLREDRERGMTRPETPIETLYDERTGLPA